MTLQDFSPAGLTALIAVVGAIVQTTAVIVTLRLMAKRADEKHAALAREVEDVQREVYEQGRMLSDHSGRVRVLEYKAGIR
jgi:protein-disulfide isomerase-like protein with CxxC motif